MWVLWFDLLPNMAEYRLDGSPNVLRGFGDWEEVVREPDECEGELFTSLILLVVR